jgi:hypothetical protein
MFKRSMVRYNRHYGLRKEESSIIVLITNTGIGLSISAIIYHYSENLYHLRLIYDNISLAGLAFISFHITPLSALLEFR